MKVFGLLSRKGGVGKTTLAVHLAVLAQQGGQRTLLIDLDPQGSAAAWWRAREAETPALVETQPAELRGILDAARADGVDLVVIDTRPSVGADVAHVAALADLVLIPTRPAIFDLRAILGTLDVVKGAARRSLLVINACPPARRGGLYRYRRAARPDSVRRGGCAGSNHQPRCLRRRAGHRLRWRDRA
jgi:chromosome partitioning protein